MSDIGMSLFPRKWSARICTSLILFSLSGCMIYKTREFTQINPVKFESWNITADATAFSRSSGASWENHKFRVFVDISRYPDYLDSEYRADITNLVLFSGDCSSNIELELGNVEVKNHGKYQHGRVSADASEPVLIEQTIKNICVHINEDFIPLDGGPIITKPFEIGMRRYESSILGPVLD